MVSKQLLNLTTLCNANFTTHGHGAFPISQHQSLKTRNLGSSDGSLSYRLRNNLVAVESKYSLLQMSRGLLLLRHKPAKILRYDKDFALFSRFELEQHVSISFLAVVRILLTLGCDN